MAIGSNIEPATANYWAGLQGANESTAKSLEQYLKLLGGGGNPLTGAAISAGEALLGQLASLLGGPSAGEKRKRETYGMAKGGLNKNMLDPQGMVQDVFNMMRPEMNRKAGDVNKRLGLDAGVAQGEMMNMFTENAQNQLFGLKLKQAEMNMNNRNMLLSIMASLGSD